MSVLVIQFLPQPDTDADADQMAANFNAITAVVNGNLEAGTNVRTGPPQALTGAVGDEGGSLLVARSDHTHVVRGFEVLAADPTGGNFIGRLYYNSATTSLRMCTNAAGSGTWITVGNLLATDLPAHASRHATGGADPLPNNSVAQTMLAARTLYSGVPGADVNLSANAWTDIATGVSPIITGTQLATLHVNALVQNTAGNTPTVGLRVIDGSSNILAQSGSHQFGASGGGSDSDHISFSKPVTLSASPTLKLQADANATGISIRKTQNLNGSSFAVTALDVVVG